MGGGENLPLHPALTEVDKNQAMLNTMAMRENFVFIFIVSAMMMGIYFTYELDGGKKQENTESCMAKPASNKETTALIGNNLNSPNMLVTKSGDYLGDIVPDISLKNNNGKIALFFFAFCVLIYGVIITIPQNMRIKEIEE